MRWEICEHILSTDSFRTSDLKCSSENVVYLFASKTCYRQYKGSTEDSRLSFNNYGCAHSNFLERAKVK